VSGPDLSFHEVTINRDTYPEETATVEVSENGSTWFNLGTIGNHDSGTGVSLLDFNSTGLATINYIRLTDATDYSLHNDAADGYDLDAFDAFTSTCQQPD